MGILRSIDLIVSEMGPWKPSDIAFIRSFGYIGYIEEEDGSSFSELRLIGLAQLRQKLNKGWPDFHSSFWEISFRFIDIQNFHIRHRGMGDLQITGFSIEDVSDRQWEGVGLEISDYEDEKISFYARQGEILSCKKIVSGPSVSVMERIVSLEG